MFPGPNAQVYYNEAGEPLGWEYPSEPDPHDSYDRLDGDDEKWQEALEIAEDTLYGEWLETVQSLDPDVDWQESELYKKVPDLAEQIFAEWESNTDQRQSNALLQNLYEAHHHLTQVYNRLQEVKEHEVKGVI
jgi:hypothetical protein